MKRVLAAVVLTSLIGVGATRAADAVALAAEQEAEERYKRINATVDEIQNTQAAQQRQISALATEFSKLRDEIARNNDRAVTQDALKRLNEQILKVDEARLTDNKKIYEALEKLGSTIKSLPTPPVPRPHDTPPASNPGAQRNGTNPPLDGEFFEYTVQSGDYLDFIVKAYRDQKIPVTRKSVEDANPNVKWNKLRIGQKLLIPKPK